jgi:hypothetical protein
MATLTRGESITIVNTVQKAIKAKAMSMMSTTVDNGMTAPITRVARKR